ncbi:branched-chain amino acid ABC transporter permease [Roseiarcaceae bacterium H3SJ34-1]|uniref:branched-chain amino acid ABC transporter permease n=1 Tax=Terripilifer ovatus TaxID=3032367 RepID=UPI003AB9199A|nr:branched-chain amino acid ABC transporter permease [Roseiarcaceae bacterium H3SJ34-1]
MKAALIVAGWIAAPVLYMALFPDSLVLASQILLMGLFALSLDLLVGYAGVASLGHAVFFGIGAYGAGLLAANGWGEPLSALVLTMLVAAIFALPVGLLVVRGGSLGRLMITLGIATLVSEAANRASGITGGADGLQGMDVWPLLGLFSYDLQGRTGFVYAWIVLTLGFLAVRSIVASPFGLSLQAIRENPVRAAALGTPVRARLTFAFVLSAALAGAAGAVMAQTTQVVALNSLGVHLSADVLVMLLIGGVGRLYGGLIGAAIFMVVHHWLSDLDPVYWQIWIGLILIGAALAAPDGILGAIEKLRSRKQVAW